MAYIISSAIDPRQNLEFDLRGGDRDRIVDGLRDGEKTFRGNLKSCLMYGIRVPNDLCSAVPTEIEITPGPDGIPDFGYSGELGGCFVVSDKVVDLIERLEPNVHQFLKIATTVVVGDGSYNRSFFVLNILIRLLAVDIERSSVEVSRLVGGHETLRYKPGPANKQKLVLKKNVCAEHHLWRGGGVNLRLLLFAQPAFVMKQRKTDCPS